jgi:hypothetical protein
VSNVEIDLGPEWDRAIAHLEKLRKAAPKALQTAILQDAHFLRGEIIKGIDSQAPAGKPFDAHRPITVAVRQLNGFSGTKILIGPTGSLRAGVTVKPLPDGGAFVGVHRSARTKDGRSLVRIARIHEEGRAWEQERTAKQRRFLFLAMKRAGITPVPRGGGTTVKIRIPARPFIGPIAETLGTEDKVAARVAERLKDLLP